MDSTDPWGTLGAHVVEAKGARGARVGGGVSVVSLAHSKFGWGEQRVGNRVSRRPCTLTPTARCGADLCQTCNFPDEVPSTTGGPCHSTRLGGAPLRPLASACRCPAPTAHRFRATRRAARLRSSTAPSSPRTTLASGCADTCLRTVRTGCVYRPPCVPYAPEAQGSLARGRHCCTCAVCVPALGVPCVPRTVWCMQASFRSRRSGRSRRPCRTRCPSGCTAASRASSAAATPSPRSSSIVSRCTTAPPRPSACGAWRATSLTPAHGTRPSTVR